MLIPRANHVYTIARILESLPGNAIQVQTRTGFTYSHILKILKSYDEKGLLYITKTGRELNIKITRRGNRLKKAILEVERLISD